MKKWKRMAAWILCLSLMASASFAEDSAGEPDTVTSATQQQENSFRGERPQAPDQGSRHFGENRRSGQKQGPAGQMPDETAPGRKGRMPGQDVQAPDSGEQQPDTEGQQKQPGRKSGKKNHSGQPADSRNKDPQSVNNPPVSPETPADEPPASGDGAEALSGWIKSLEKKIEELGNLLKSLNEKKAAE